MQKLEVISTPESTDGGKAHSTERGGDIHKCVYRKEIVWRYRRGNSRFELEFALRMFQLQILAGKVLHNVTDKLVSTLRHDLYGAKSFAAGMQKSLETFGKVRRLLPGGQQATLKLVYANPMAGANAVMMCDHPSYGPGGQESLCLVC